MKFKKGDIVVWGSQSAGFYKEKQGLIVEVIQPGQNPYRLKQFPYELYRKVDPSTVLPRKQESYLIAVKGKTNKSKSKLYWPRVTHLNLKRPS
jgi:hypothetical protein